MKKVKMLLVFLTAFVLAFTTCYVATPPQKAEAVTTSQAFVDAMSPGWNLGNSFDAVGSSGETSWGNPVVTQQFIQSIKAQGYNSIRMPLTLYGRMGGAPNYTIDSAYLTRYAQVVQWAVDAGLYVMVNIHHDSWNWAQYINATDDNGVAMAEYIAVWTQLANYFKNFSSNVCFESLNEPYFEDHSGSVTEAVQMQRLVAVNTQFHSIVRASGGNNATRMLVLPTLFTGDGADYCTSLYNTIIGLNDPNIIATAHYYGYWPFSVNIAGETTFNDATTGFYLRDSFDRLYNNFTARGIGVVIGEYGLLGFDKGSDTVEHGEMLKYYEYINYYSKSKGISLMLWDNGGHFNRNTLTWNDPTLYNTIKFAGAPRSSYSSFDRYFVTSANKANDIPINLTLNGNTLTSIYNGATQLVAGTDYTYSNGVVTLKGSYVSPLMTGSYGQKATLTMKFSAGADWNVYLNYYTTPVLSASTGKITTGLNIPVQFNGSTLATIEAVNSSGAGVGPQNWTTYKEYNYCFTVNYATNTVSITPKFFAECTAGTITLKLHFWSGEVINYVIKIKGPTVTSM